MSTYTPGGFRDGRRLRPTALTTPARTAGAGLPARPRSGWWSRQACPAVRGTPSPVSRESARIRAETTASDSRSRCPSAGFRDVGRLSNCQPHRFRGRHAPLGIGLEDWVRPAQSPPKFWLRGNLVRGSPNGNLAGQQTSRRAAFNQGQAFRPAQTAAAMLPAGIFKRCRGSSRPSPGCATDRAGSRGCSNGATTAITC